jgi:hypothetical protein
VFAGPARCRRQHTVELLDHGIVGDVAEKLSNERHVLELVAIAVDDGMAESIPNPRGRVARDEAHHGRSFLASWSEQTRWTGVARQSHSGAGVDAAYPRT